MLQRSLLRSILIGISRCFRKVHIDLCKPFNLAGPVAVVRHGVLAGGWPSGGRIRARPLAGQFGEQVPVIVIARKQTNPRSLFRLRLFRFHQAVSAKPPEDETKPPIKFPLPFPPCTNTTSQSRQGPGTPGAPSPSRK